MNLTLHPDGRDQSVVLLEDVSVGYRGHAALEDVSLSVNCAERIAVIGPNGAGKTTLFKAILGLLPLASGRVRLFGGEAARGRARIGYVPQREAVNWDFPVTVAEVVMMGRYGRLGFLRQPGAADWAAVRAALARVDMAAFAERQIGRLSSGQQQRVFIARALAQEADVLLLDEPFTGVDVTTQQNLFELIAQFRERDCAVLVATHDLNTVMGNFDRVLCLNRRVIAYGPPEEVFNAAVLSETFGRQLVVLPTDPTRLVMDDAHGHFG
jgi:anchored repeat-type ABC transporter ATP-binding subunit